MSDRVEKSEAEWREQLTAEQFEVCRTKGTERAFTGRYWDNKEDGLYRCAGCETDLFDSDTKYDSGSGWPSFTRPADRDATATSVDRSLGMVRTEASCARCDAHLGHVFPDGPPQDTGERWCINSAALNFCSSDGYDDR